MMIFESALDPSVYCIEYNDTLIIIVLDIGPRGDIYK